VAVFTYASGQLCLQTKKYDSKATVLLTRGHWNPYRSGKGERMFDREFTLSGETRMFNCLDLVRNAQYMLCNDEFLTSDRKYICCKDDFYGVLYKGKVIAP
jgi:hypothetical protein